MNYALIWLRGLEQIDKFLRKWRSILEATATSARLCEKIFGLKSVAANCETRDNGKLLLRKCTTARRRVTRCCLKCKFIYLDSKSFLHFLHFAPLLCIRPVVLQILIKTGAVFSKKNDWWIVWLIDAVSGQSSIPVFNAPYTNIKKLETITQKIQIYFPIKRYN